MPATAAAQRRIAELVSRTAVHRAFHWLHLHQPQLRQWQMEMVQIPAPTFHESARAAWFLQRFHQLGLSNIHQDAAGNVLAELRAPSPPHPNQSPGDTPCILLSAHLDTVFPPTTGIALLEEGPCLFAPGICDNAAGLTALLALAAALRHAGIAPPIPVLFAANTGEEGEGDLFGMRHLFEHSPYRHRIAAAIALEGSGTSTVVTRALGSLRFRITFTGPGGHSWIDAGAPNPILLLAHALTRIAALPLPSAPESAHQTTLNVGHISGGTSVNSIPASASALLDIRSTDPANLLLTAAQVRHLLEDPAPAPPAANPLAPPRIEIIGNRPAATLPDDSPLLHT
ncbi:MAG: M20/M25/M40 family metallo-hydrolase, partial [Acidobacteriota bacterium]|nr:M20/M25/M40 family metallo-hydrolase [Acidobacteriota bacterium]